MTSSSFGVFLVTEWTGTLNPGRQLGTGRLQLIEGPVGVAQVVLGGHQFADLSRGRAKRAVARDLAVPEHYVRLAVGTKRSAAHQPQRGRLGRHLAIDECSVRKNFIYATVFSDPDRGVVIDMAPGRDSSAVLFFASLFSHAERARVAVVTIDCHAPYRMAARVLVPNALVVADAFHLHRRVLSALTQVRRDAWNRWRRRRRSLGQVFKDARFALARARDSLEADGSRTGKRQRMAVSAAITDGSCIAPTPLNSTSTRVSCSRLSSSPASFSPTINERRRCRSMATYCRSKGLLLRERVGFVATSVTLDRSSAGGDPAFIDRVGRTTYWASSERLRPSPDAQLVQHERGKRSVIPSPTAPRSPGCGGAARGDAAALVC